MKLRSIFILILIVFITTAIIYPLTIFVIGNNTNDNTIYYNEELIGSKIAYEEFNSSSYFQNTTNKIRPYIKKDDAIKQVKSISEVTSVREEQLNEMINNNTYNNLFYEYVNINTLNIDLFMYINE